MVMRKTVGSFSIFLIFGFIGIFITLIVSYGADNLGWDISFGGVTLAQLMSSILVIFIIVGLFMGILSAMSN